MTLVVTYEDAPSREWLVQFPLHGAAPAISPPAGESLPSVQQFLSDLENYLNEVGYTLSDNNSTTLCS